MQQYKFTAHTKGNDNLTLQLPFHQALELARSILMRIDDRDMAHDVEVIVGGTLQAEA